MALADARVTAGLFEPTDVLATAWELDFWVPGKPQTAGSKTAIPGRGPGGRPLVVDSGDRTAKRAWRADVRAAAEEALFDLEHGGHEWPSLAPLEVVFRFVRARPKSHFGTGKNEALLKETAPAWPVSRPDALKLARAAEDALTGIVWADDAQIVRELLEKEWSDRAGVSRGAEGCRVRVRRLGPQ